MKPLLVLLFLCGLVHAAPIQKLQLVNWDFVAGEEYEGKVWERVTIPHGYRLTSLNLDDNPDTMLQETFHRDLSWYRKTLTVPAESGQRVFLEFEGAHQVTDLWVNGQHVDQHAIGGYTPFHFDITAVLKEGENEVLLRLDNRLNETVPPDGDKADYVRFAGLYRDVYLVVKNAVHIPFAWEKREAGVMVTTPTVSERNATVLVRTTLRNSSEKEQRVQLRTRVIDADDRLVRTMARELVLSPGADRTELQSCILNEDDHHLWSFDDPYLYRVKTEVFQGDERVDWQENPLGLRWLDLRPEVGFCLNGKPVKLIGVNRHQHFPYFGDAVPDNLHRLDAIKMKEAGLNVVRLAHYPHDDSFLKACDELGMLVMEEAPVWIHYGPRLWMDRLEEATRRMIRNHRNHPSVWVWSGGINHRGPVHRLQLACKEEDPFRLTVNNGTLWTGPQHSGVNDLYTVMDYRGARVPEKGYLFGMEHSGSPDVVRQQKLISKYKQDPRRIGLTAWCGHDGFSFIKRGKKHPNLSVWKAGLWDVFRQPKPSYYWYGSELLTEPVVHIPDERAQNGDVTRVFSNADEVSLAVNGKTYGPLKADQSESFSGLKSPPFLFPVKWKKGQSREAVAYRSGEVVARYKQATAGAPSHLELQADQAGFDGAADGSSILLVTADIVDYSGRLVAESEKSVTFSVSGPGELIDAPWVKANPAEVERGRAVVFVRVGQEPGEIVIRGEMDNLQAGEVRVKTTAFDRDVLRRSETDVRELFDLKVDLGSPSQHQQDGWRACSKPFSAFENGVEMTISSNRDVKWTDTWGVPGDLCYMVEDGVELEAAGEIHLAFKELEPGRYSLKTWHHRLVGERAGAQQILFLPSLKEARVPSGYLPTFGRKIRVSEAGGGDAGDGGSDLAAAGFAHCLFTVGEDGEFTLVMRSEGAMNLNGFQLRQH